MKASDFIIESFDSDVQGSLVRATNDLFTTRATIGNRDIVFNASAYEDKDNARVWEIEFTERSNGNMTYGKSGSGSEMQVFSFVLDSIKELVSRYHPDIIEFGSHKADGNRSSLYKRMAKRIQLPGYHLADIESGESTDVFRIIRDTK